MTGICDVTVECPSEPVPKPECPRIDSFDAGSFVGGIFLVVGVMLIASAGYVFHTKRATKQYSSLN